MNTHVGQVSVDIWVNSSLGAAAEPSPYRGLECAIPGIHKGGLRLAAENAGPGKMPLTPASTNQ